jgi:hypothetical protein
MMRFFLTGVVMGTAIDKATFSVLDLVQYTSDHSQAGEVAIIVGPTTSETVLVVDFHNSLFSGPKKIPSSQIQPFEKADERITASSAGSSSSDFSSEISKFLNSLPSEIKENPSDLVHKRYYQGKLIGGIVWKKFGLRGLNFYDEASDETLKTLLLYLELTWRNIQEFKPRDKLISPTMYSMHPIPASALPIDYSVSEDYLIDLVKSLPDQPEALRMIFAQSNSVYAELSTDLIILVHINGEPFHVAVNINGECTYIYRHHATASLLKYLNKKPGNISTSFGIGSLKSGLVTLSDNLIVSTSVGVHPVHLPDEYHLQGELGFSGSSKSIGSKVLKYITIIPLGNFLYKIPPKTDLIPTPHGPVRIIIDNPDYVQACKDSRFHYLPVLEGIPSNYAVETDLIINGKKYKKIKVLFSTMNIISSISPKMCAVLKHKGNNYPEKPTSIGISVGEETFVYEYGKDHEYFGVCDDRVRQKGVDLNLGLNFISKFVTIFGEGRFGICEKSFTPFHIY